MGMASLSLSKIGNPQVVSIVSQIIEDLVRGKLLWYLYYVYEPRHKKACLRGF